MLYGVRVAYAKWLSEALGYYVRVLFDRACPFILQVNAVLIRHEFVKIHKPIHRLIKQFGGIFQSLKELNNLSKLKILLNRIIESILSNPIKPKIRMID